MFFAADILTPSTVSAISWNFSNFLGQFIDVQHVSTYTKEFPFFFFFLTGLVLLVGIF